MGRTAFGYLDVIIDTACALLDHPDIAIDLLEYLFDHSYLIVDMVCGLEGSRHRHQILLFRQGVQSLKRIFHVCLSH